MRKVTTGNRRVTTDFEKWLPLKMATVNDFMAEVTTVTTFSQVHITFYR